MDLINRIRKIYDNYGYKTMILAASIRHLKHMLDCALAGADVATVPFQGHHGPDEAPAHGPGAGEVHGRLQEGL